MKNLGLDWLLKKVNVQQIVIVESACKSGDMKLALTSGSVQENVCATIKVKTT